MPVQFHVFSGSNGLPGLSRTMGAEWNLQLCSLANTMLRVRFVCLFLVLVAVFGPTFWEEIFLCHPCPWIYFHIMIWVGFPLASCCANTLFSPHNSNSAVQSSPEQRYCSLLRLVQCSMIEYLTYFLWSNTRYYRLCELSDPCPSLCYGYTSFLQVCVFPLIYLQVSDWLFLYFNVKFAFPGILHKHQN